MATFGKVVTALLIAVGAVITAAAIIDHIYSVEGYSGGTLCRIWRRIRHAFSRCCRYCDDDLDFLRDELEDELADYRDQLEEEEEVLLGRDAPSDDEEGLKF